MTALTAKFIIEIMGRPVEHLEKSLSELIDKMGSEKGTSILHKEIHKTKKVEKVDNLWTTFADVEMKFETLPLLFNAIDRRGPWVYNLPIITQKVGESGDKGRCSTESTNITLTGKAVSSFPLNSGRYSKKTMWNDFSSLGALIRVSLYSRRMSGRSRNQSLNCFHSHPAKPEISTGSISRELAKSPATNRAGSLFPNT